MKPSSGTEMMGSYRHTDIPACTSSGTNGATADFMFRDTVTQKMSRREQKRRAKEEGTGDEMR